MLARALLMASFMLISGSACTAAQRRSLHAQHADSAPIAEANVPRVVCYDGNLAVGCSLEQANLARCCESQGGVYRDAWGNVVAH